MTMKGISNKINAYLITTFIIIVAIRTVHYAFSYHFLCRFKIQYSRVRLNVHF